MMCCQRLMYHKNIMAISIPLKFDEVMGEGEVKI